MATSLLPRGVEESQYAGEMMMKEEAQEEDEYDMEKESVANSAHDEKKFATELQDRRREDDDALCVEDDDDVHPLTTITGQKETARFEDADDDEVVVVDAPSERILSAGISNDDDGNHDQQVREDSNSHDKRKGQDSHDDNNDSRSARSVRRHRRRRDGMSQDQDVLPKQPQTPRSQQFVNLDDDDDAIASQVQATKNSRQSRRHGRAAETRTDHVVDLVNQEEEDGDLVVVTDLKDSATTNAGHRRSRKESPGTASLVTLLDDDEREEGEEVLLVKVGKRDPNQDPEELEREEQDRKLALEIQQAWREEARSQKREQDEKLMAESITGRAWKFVEHVLELHKTLQEAAEVTAVASTGAASSSITPVATDDMVFLAERLASEQEAYRRLGIPTKVDLGYHYTRSENMSRIRTDGLLTKAERDQKNINAHFNGIVHGDGVYTGNDPCSFLCFGDIGILVARLQGRTTKTRGAPRKKKSRPITVTASLENTFLNGAMTVLRSSAQCLPLFQYPSSLFCQRSDLLQLYHNQFQALVDSLFNDGVTTKPVTFPAINATHAAWAQSSVPFSLNPLVAAAPPAALMLQPTASFQQSLAQTIASMQQSQAAFHASAQQTLASLSRGASFGNTFGNATRLQPFSTYSILYSAPAGVATTTARTGGGMQPVHEDELSWRTKCSVCLVSIRKNESKPLVRFQGCRHIFHRDCVQGSLMQGQHCPNCARTTKPAQSRVLSGTLTIACKQNETCLGHTPGTIFLDYNMWAGTELGGSAQRAYIPDTLEGRYLLLRLQEAFRRGLTFAVTRTSNSSSGITFAIRHKTSMQGGPADSGYPDPYFLNQCNAHLDALGIPRGQGGTAAAPSAVTPITMPSPTPRRIKRRQVA